jgi:uncharacterized damage-inducible protein DinB
MTTLEHLRDLIAHMEWADAAHWRAVAAHGVVFEDPSLRDRLHHIHMVQRYFHSVVTDGPFPRTHPGDFATLEALRAYGREGLAALVTAAGTLDAAAADTLRPIPWFKDPPLAITMGQALTQVALHSQHHRGQNAVRLRELGVAPPATDMIVWWWQGRPPAAWE